MKTINIFIFLFCCCTFSHAQDSMEEAWNCWKRAEYSCAEEIAMKNLSTNDGLHLLGNIEQLRGNYRKATEYYFRVSEDYPRKNEVLNNLTGIYFDHLKDIEKAKKYSKGLENTPNVLMANLIERSLELECSGQFIIPMETDHPLNNYIPIVKSSINGQERKIAFDTGGNYLLMPASFAQELGIEYEEDKSFEGKQGFSSSKMYIGMVNEFVLGSEVKLKNVPVIILEEMNTELIIFGTNIIKEFLCTIDYPNNQFILTTKDRKDLIKAHLDKYQSHEMNFVLWADHYMMGKGNYNGEAVNMFFDSGLVVVGQKDGKPVQSWLCMSDENMKRLGIPQEEASQRSVLFTDDQLEFAEIKLQGVVMNSSREREFEFGGVQCQLLISHGVISKFAWTIDFDNRKYYFK